MVQDGFRRDVAHRQLRRGTGPTSASLSSLSLSANDSTESLFGPSASLAELSAYFKDFQNSLRAKLRYYAPATAKVLTDLDKGVAKRRTTHGEALRKLGEMKARWERVNKRVNKVEDDMKAVEKALNEEADHAQAGTGGVVPEEHVGRTSPFRRLANKLSSKGSPVGLNSTPTRPPPRFSAGGAGPLDSPSSVRSSPAGTPTAQGFSAKGTPPTRPPRSLLRNGATPPSTASLTGSAQPSLSTPPPRTPSGLHHQRSSSALGSSFAGYGGGSGSGGGGGGGAGGRSVRAPSPAMSNGSGYGAPKPRWNISVKRDDHDDKLETLRTSVTKSRPPISGRGYTPARSGAPPPSGRHSSMGFRSVSRQSQGGGMVRSTSSQFGRPGSPTWSEVSSASGIHRDRPETPGSRIPMPSPGGGVMGRSTTPFSSLHGTGSTSLMQRAMTPTAGVGLGLASSVGRPPSRAGGGGAGSKLPTPARPASRAGQSQRRGSVAYSVGPDGGLSPPRAPSPTHSVASTAYSNHHWRGAPTPEPQLEARAKRMSFLRQPQAKAPPMPPMPQTWRSTSGSGPATPSRMSARPPSRLGAAAGAKPSGLTFPATYPEGYYQPNPADPLDTAVAAVVNALPMEVGMRRIDLHWTRAELDHKETFQARYAIGAGEDEDGLEVGGSKAVVCKLVDRLGPRSRDPGGAGSKAQGKKVLVQVGRGLGAGWQELEGYCLGRMARGG